MKTTTWIAAAASGLVAGAALVIACSDDSTNNADAAVCDCPAAEPPLAGRIVSVRASNSLAAGSIGAASAGCPAGATLLGGACEIENDDANVLLSFTKVTRGPSIASFACHWSTASATVDNTGTAEAICLIPAT